MSKLRTVSKTHPCPVCGGTHKCSFNIEGLLLCGRKTGDQPGFVCLGPSKNPTWTMYKVEDATPPPARSGSEGRGPSLALRAGEDNFESIARKFARQLPSALAQELCIHHVRKSGGEHGTASRGSGAIAGFFDVMLELGYATGDPDGRRRKLQAKGRLDGIPAETLVEMTKDGEGYKLVDEREKTADRVRQREEGEDARRSSLREVLCVTVPFGEEKAMTRDEIWNRLPEEVRVNVKRFEAVLEAGVGTLWTTKKGPGKGQPLLFWRQPI